MQLQLRQHTYCVKVTFLFLQWNCAGKGLYGKYLINQESRVMIVCFWWVCYFTCSQNPFLILRRRTGEAGKHSFEPGLCLAYLHLDPLSPVPVWTSFQFWNWADASLGRDVWWWKGTQICIADTGTGSSLVLRQNCKQHFLDEACFPSCRCHGI